MILNKLKQWARNIKRDVVALWLAARDPRVLGELAATKLVIDGRNCLDPVLWARAGWTYRGMGRPHPAV